MELKIPKLRNPTWLPEPAADGREGAGCGCLHPGCRRSVDDLVRDGDVGRLQEPGSVRRDPIRSTASSIDRWRATGPNHLARATYVKARSRPAASSNRVWLLAVNTQGRRRSWAWRSARRRPSWTESCAAGPARAARREAGDLRRPQGPEGPRPGSSAPMAALPRASPATCPCRPPSARRLRLRRHRQRRPHRGRDRQLRPKVPKLAVLMDEAEHDVLGKGSSFPRAAAEIASSKPIERLHASHRRRIFPNEAATGARAERRVGQDT